jgi:hypothetical protein
MFVDLQVQCFFIYRCDVSVCDELLGKSCECDAGRRLVCHRSGPVLPGTRALPALPGLWTSCWSVLHCAVALMHVVDSLFCVCLLQIPQKIIIFILKDKFLVGQWYTARLL